MFENDVCKMMGILLKAHCANIIKLFDLIVCYIYTYLEILEAKMYIR